MDDSKKTKHSKGKLVLIAACIIGTYAIIAAILLISSRVEKNEIFIQIFGEIVKIRSAPDSSSDIIGNALQGEIFLLLDTVNDAHGYEWYQIPIGDKTGYIRCDLATIVE